MMDCSLLMRSYSRYLLLIFNLIFLVRAYIFWYIICLYLDKANMVSNLPVIFILQKTFVFLFSKLFAYFVSKDKQGTVYRTSFYPVYQLFYLFLIISIFIVENDFHSQFLLFYSCKIYKFFLKFGEFWYLTVMFFL